MGSDFGEAREPSVLWLTVGPSISGHSSLHMTWRNWVYKAIGGDSPGTHQASLLQTLQTMAVLAPRLLWMTNSKPMPEVGNSVHFFSFEYSLFRQVSACLPVSPMSTYSVLPAHFLLYPVEWHQHLFLTEGRSFLYQVLDHTLSL